MDGPPGTSALLLARPSESASLPVMASPAAKLGPLVRHFRGGGAALRALYTIGLPEGSNQRGADASRPGPRDMGTPPVPLPLVAALPAAVPSVSTLSSLLSRHSAPPAHPQCLPGSASARRSRSARSPAPPTDRQIWHPQYLLSYLLIGPRNTATRSHERHPEGPWGLTNHLEGPGELPWQSPDQTPAPTCASF